MRYIDLFAGIGGFRLGIEQWYLDCLNRKEDGRGEEYETNDDEEEWERLESPTGEAIRIENRLLGEYDNLSLAGQESPTCVYTNEWDKYAADIYEKRFNTTIDRSDITTVDADSIPNHDLLCGGFPCQAFSVAGKRRGFEDTRGTLFFDIARILKAKRPTYLLLENVKGLLSHDNNRTFQTILWTLDELGYDLQWQVLNSKNFGVPQNRERVFIIGHLRGERRPEVFPITGQSNKYSTEQKSTKTAVARTLTGGGHTGGNHSGMTILRQPYWDSYEVEGQIRRLTPVECERLQGFPDNWTEGVSDTQRYKTLGNAVTVNVVEYIISKMFELSKEKEE